MLLVQLLTLSHLHTFLASSWSPRVISELSYEGMTKISSWIISNTTTTEITNNETLAHIYPGQSQYIKHT